MRLTSHKTIRVPRLLCGCVIGLALAGCDPGTSCRDTGRSIICEVDGKSRTYRLVGGKADAPSYLFGTCIKGDVDNDHSVGLSDMILVANGIGTADPDADLDHSGAVDRVDLDIVAARYGCSYVPEITAGTWVIGGTLTRRPLTDGRWSEATVCVDSIALPNASHAPYVRLDGAKQPLVIGDCVSFAGFSIEVCRHPSTAGSTGTFTVVAEARLGETTPWALDGTVRSVPLSDDPVRAHWLRVCTSDLSHLPNVTHHPFLEVDGRKATLGSSKCVEVHGHRIAVRRRLNTGPSAGSAQLLD